MPYALNHLDLFSVLEMILALPSELTSLSVNTSVRVAETMKGNIVITMINAGMPVILTVVATNPI